MGQREIVTPRRRIMTSHSLSRHDNVACVLLDFLCYWPEALCSRRVRLSVRSSVADIAKTIFWKRTKRFCSELAQVMARERNHQRFTLGSKGQMSRSHDVEVRFWIVRELRGDRRWDATPILCRPSKFWIHRHSSPDLTYVLSYSATIAVKSCTAIVTSTTSSMP